MNTPSPITALSLVEDSLTEYCEQCTDNEPAICGIIRAAVADHPKSHWVSGPLVGTFLQMLILMIGAKRILDIGTFYGYSAAYMASAASEVKVTSIDIDEKHSKSAKKLLQGSIIEQQVTMVTANIEQWLFCNSEQFDLVFFDSDKSRIDRLYDALMKVIRPGGILVIDNACVRGKVKNPSTPWQISTDQFNHRAKLDKCVMSTILPVRDGLLLNLKLSSNDCNQ